MSILSGVITLVKTTHAIRTIEKRMRERNEAILDNVRIRKLETVKWDNYIIY